MNLLVGLGVVVVAAAVAVASMLLIRRRAPDGGYFNDGDRAAGVFGVLATGFSVLVGFLIFLAFTSYDNSRTGAEEEASTVRHQVETAQFFEPPLAAELTGELVCYARSVVAIEWDRMTAGTQGDRLNGWGVELYRTMRTIEPDTDSRQSAYDEWLDQTADREDARNARIHGDAGIMPVPLWAALFLTSAVVFGFMLLFADSGERALVQGALMGSVVAVMTTLLLLLWFLDDPFHDGVGGIQPAAMERTLNIIDEMAEATGTTLTIPCDARGERT